MRSFLIALIECSVAMSVLILLFIAITPLLEKRYVAKWRYYAWLVIVIGLIIPFRPHFDTALIQMDTVVAPSYTQKMPSDNSEPSGNNPTQSPIQRAEPGVVGMIPDDNPPIGTGHRGWAAIPWYCWAGYLWLTGTVIFITYQSLRQLRFLKMVKRWSQRVTDQQTLNILQSLQAELEVSQQVKLQVCPSITSPMMLGFVNPVILLPATNFSVDELFFVLKHELVHFKRKDLWYKSLVLIAVAIHWFNPIVYLMAKAIAVQCEISCDAEVVKNTDRYGRQLYSETIIGVIEKPGMQTVFSTDFYGGKKGMRNRITAIMDTTRKKTGVFVLCAVLIGTIGTGTIFSASANASGDLKPLSERGGAITTYYNPYATLEDNVLGTLGIDSDKDEICRVRVTGPTYIDANGRKIDYYNRTDPYYGIEWGWEEKSAIQKMMHKMLSVEGKNVTVAFTDDAAAYRDDKVIEKMIINQIVFELGYHSKNSDYDHQAFINELINRGAYVIKDVVTPENFKPRVWQNKNGDFLGMKLLTDYDQKNKITDIFKQEITLHKNVNGNQGVQLGDRFVIKHGETLAIDIKETTDKMPTVNLAIINVTTGEFIDWMPGVRGGYRFIYTPREAYANHNFKIVMSGEESDNAYIEIFTYKTGKDEISHDDCREALMYKTDYVGVTDAVARAIKSRSSSYLQGETVTEGHIILDTEEQKGTVKVYAISSVGVFGFENGIFTKISGSGVVPTVMTFSKNQQGGYELLEYKEAEDGSGYTSSIKKMFPRRLQDRVRSTHDDYSNLKKQQEEQAQEYLRSIGRAAEVRAHVKKKRPNIDVEASNKLFAEYTKNDAFLNACPYWLGTRECIENGQRFIYETSQSKTGDGCDLITFRKTRANGTVVEERQYKIEGSVIRSHPTVN